MNKKQQKKLSIAFVWHMHQPVYQIRPEDVFLMPWVRLHAVKDYLDMLLMLEKFPNLKLNFNLVPVLVDAIEAYAEKGFHDIHSQLTVSDVELFSYEDKMFVLNHFFDANYKNMVLHHKYYSELYAKRYAKDNISVDDFTLSEYSDIMTWFNLAWIDPIWKAKYPEINYLLEKEKGFSQQDRVMLIELQRKIIAEIIPTYRRYQDEDRIEISTSPYYHPILPLLIDINDARKTSNRYSLFDGDLNMKEDAVWQVKSALDRMEEVFGKRPKGIWPSEHCISKKTMDLLTELGVKWTIADEGILASSLGKEFVRDFRGYMEDPYALTKTYRYFNADKHIDVVFRDSVIPNLISFEYPHHDSVMAANDFYDRIKTVQKKLEKLPDKHHVLTIAMDGENSWENYIEDGEIFLTNVYNLIEEDETLKTVLMSEHLQEVRHPKILTGVTAGSWINRDFQLWIGEPTKNIAWKYLDKARQDLVEFQKTTNNKEQIAAAWRQIYITQGSDWFWWYGEPNDSGQDQIFDYLYREHLKQVYLIMDQTPPKYLDDSLIQIPVNASREAKSLIAPKINGKLDNINSWKNAGQIEAYKGPNIRVNKSLSKIFFGHDNENIYMRFELNPLIYDKKKGFKDFFQISVCFKHQGAMTQDAHLRFANRLEGISVLVKETYNTEVTLTFDGKKEFSPQIFYVGKDKLWINQLSHKVEYVFDEVAEMKIPFDDIGLQKGEAVNFVVVDSSLGIVEEVYPESLLLKIKRP